MSKVLIFCALFVTVQAGYSQSGHGSDKGNAENGGYSAFLKPRVSIQVFPPESYGGSAGGYGGSPKGEGGSAGANGGSAGGCGGSAGGSGGTVSINSGISAPLIAAAQSHNSISSLANLALSLPSPGLPHAAIINVPQHAITSYSSPAVVIQSGAAPAGRVSASNAAIASSIIRSAGSGNGPSQAGGYSSSSGSAGSRSHGGSAAY